MTVDRDMFHGYEDEEGCFQCFAWCFWKLTGLRTKISNLKCEVCLEMASETVIYALSCWTGANDAIDVFHNDLRPCRCLLVGGCRLEALRNSDL